MSDLAEIAAELRRVVPIEHWHLVDKLVNHVIDEMIRKMQFDMKEMIRERQS